MRLNQDQMKKVFEDLGFTEFDLLDNSDDIQRFFSTAIDDNVSAYVVDVVPGRLIEGDNNGIALLETHFYQPLEYEKLRAKWNTILIQFSCYYHLESVFVAGIALPSDEDFPEKVPNDGYVLKFDALSITDMDSFISLVHEKTFGDMIFWFPSLNLMFHYYQDDVYLIAGLKQHSKEIDEAIDLLRRLSAAQGLFLYANAT